MPQIAFIGAGRMATAIVDGLLAQKACVPTELTCLSGSGRSAEILSERTGIRLARTLEDLLAPADVVIVAFKPQHLAHADPRLSTLTINKLVVSVLAAKKLETLHETFPKARNIIRTMPNTPSAIGAGMTGWCTLAPLAPPDRTIVTDLLQTIGRETEVPETQMDALMAISGCGPAFVFEFTAALREAGVSAGLPRDTAQTLAIETILGSARLMARSKAQPEELRDQVTSPNGTTFAGLQRMAASDFRGLILATVLAAKTRSEELSRSL